MKVLVTGGTGFIGSHVVADLLEQNSEIVVLDNLRNSSREVIDRLRSLASTEFDFIEGDVRDTQLVREVIATHAVDAVVHLAGLKSVSESVRFPLDYYDSNLVGSIALLNAMAAEGVYRLVFSSSATVYGSPESTPITESHPVGRVENPYGRSKYFVEEVLKDLVASDKRWSVAILRYFNPAGAHSSGAIGESPKGTPNNLVPILTKVALGKMDKVFVYGDDYPTVDGSGVRDYVHVCDLAKGHVQALDYIFSESGLHVWNMGAGRGYSVMEVLKSFESVIGKSIPHEFSGRRPGDVAECWADISKVKRELGWKSDKDIHQIVQDAWRWQSLNPEL
ncbi:UDP-glucose 4-epimerase GalE [Pseudomonas schmalbachii]|uniref:UDP-glucose 4-epimerase n=1 Tax=Pseudomonas schmalbachii TaxID=2816993 RepID=A0ABS3TPS2_9PSED|nr:UDP-glucose 4-epimerase GalE [Pseudomonas schmalbachii]MBO3274589.1 UDP-glucose 4-epimerase GalE [Pseudomonas schmalbachii]